MTLSTRQRTPAEIDYGHIHKVPRIAPLSLPWEKIFLDKLLGLFFLAVSSPIWILIFSAAIIENLVVPENRGSFFYTEIRMSAGRPFNLHKIRILKKDAINKIRRDGAVPKQVENEPGSITGVGRVLKKFGLDEMAQMINIVRGDMTFIGPRPKPVTEYEAELELGIKNRALVRAGLTGPAQIMKGTKRTTEDERQADSRYVELIKNGSAYKIFAFDLSVLWETAKVVLKGTNE